jgi:NADH:ubiquinone oxidoreductase subunit 4 (subunit M)
MFDLAIFCTIFLPLVLAAVYAFIIDRDLMRDSILVLFSAIQVIVALFLNYSANWVDPSIFKISDASVFTWSAQWNINFGLGVSAVSAPLLIILGVVFAAYYLSASPRPNERERIVASLVVQSMVGGAFLSVDLFSYLFFSAAASLAVAFLLSFDHGLRKDGALKKFLSFEAIAVVFSSVSLIGGIKYAQSGLDWLTLANGEYQLDAKTILFISLCSSFLLRSFVYPFMVSKSIWVNAKPVGILIPAMAFSTLGLYGFFRYIPQIYAAEWGRYSPMIAILALGTIFICSIKLSFKRTHRGNILSLVSLYHGFALLGLASGNRFGILGGWSILIFALLASTAYVSLLVIAENRGQELGSNYSISGPIGGTAYVFSLLLSFGFPISIGFYGIAFVLWGVANWNPYLFYFGVVSIPFLMFGAIQNLMSTEAFGFPTDEAKKNPTWSLREGMVFAPVAGMLLLSGLMPNGFFNAFMPIVELILKQLGRN